MSSRSPIHGLFHLVASWRGHTWAGAAVVLRISYTLGAIHTQAPGVSLQEGQGSQLTEGEMGSEKLAKLFNVTQGELNGARCELEPIASQPTCFPCYS